MAESFIPNIIEEIAGLSLKSALAYLVSHGIYDFTKEGFEKLKKIIQDKYNKGKYAFVPDKNEIIILLELKNDRGYKGISLLIPKYKNIDLIRTGLLINNYQNNKTEKNEKRVKKIKLQIINRPNGKYLLKIVNLPTTPFFSLIVNYMYHLKLEGYSNSALEEKFNEIVNLWENNSIFVKQKTTTKEVELFIKKRISKSEPFFFVLGMRSVGNKIKKIIHKFDESGFLSNLKYEWTITESESAKVEIVVHKKT
ncbi:MAG: hypothetical protein ACTSUV_01595 [Candidatus Ranarchaeia archaeon]